MSKTLFDCTLETARVLKVLTEGVATGGSTSTVIDTVERTEADDFWNGGTVWITYDAGGAGAAPQGEYGYISDFVSSTGVITIRTALTQAVASGDRYAVSRIRYPLQLLIQAVNEAITRIEPIEITDISTITTAASQTEYSLPAGLIDLREVYIQTNSGDTNDYQWRRIYDWKIQKSATGTADVLILKQYASGWLIKLVYLGYHQTLRAATDKLDDSIHIYRVACNAAFNCVLSRDVKVGESDPSIDKLVNFYQALAQQADERHPVRQTPKRAKTVDIQLLRP